MASGQVYGTKIDRSAIVFSGPQEEQSDFLQSLVSNDVTRAGPDRLVYAALLTPQGKYLSDFFIRLSPEGDFILDVAPDQADALSKRLTMYKLRRPITLESRPAPVAVLWGGDAPEDGLTDPRHPNLGWRVYEGHDTALSGTETGDYDLHRLKLAIPQSGTDLIPNDTYILEAGFEAMNGVDFKKGCYVGQEIVSRMKHKTELRKGYVPVTVSSSVTAGETIITEEGKPAGTLYSNRDAHGLALIRYDRAAKAERLTAGTATVGLI